MLRPGIGAPVVDSAAGDDGKSFWKFSVAAGGEVIGSCTPGGNDLVLPGVNTPSSVGNGLLVRIRFRGGPMICKSEGINPSGHGGKGTAYRHQILRREQGMKGQ